MARFDEAAPERFGRVERLVAIAAAHHRLLWIHPFADGNGRVARLLSRIAASTGAAPRRPLTARAVRQWPVPERMPATSPAGREAVKQHNPSIVYLSVVGYGTGGRYGGRPAYDDLIQAASGIPMLLQRSTGQPRFIPMAAIDRIVGSVAASALLAGLLVAAHTGIAQHIEVPMFETMAQFVLSEHMQGCTFDPPTSPAGYPRTLSPHRRPCQTKGGFIAVLPYNGGQRCRVFQAIGKLHVVGNDPRFADIAARTANIDALYEMLGEELKSQTTDEWLDLRQHHDIPCIRPKAVSTQCVSPAHGHGSHRHRMAVSLPGLASTRGRSLRRRATRRERSTRCLPSERR